jgi:hypothetical protein
MAYGMLTDFLQQLQQNMGGSPLAMNIPNTPPMVENPAQQPQQPQPVGQAPTPQGGTGFMDFIGSPQGKGLLYGAGMGLLAKMNNVNDPVVPTAMAAADQFKKQAALQALGQQIASANLTPAQKAFIQAAFTSQDPAMMNSAMKLIENGKNQVVGAGGAVVDPTGKVLFQNPASSNKGKYAGAQAMDLFAQQLKLDNDTYGYGWDDKDIKVAQDRYLKGYKTMPDGRPLPELQGTASEYANQAIKAGTNSQGLTQTRSARMVDKILKEGESQIEDAAKYAGIAGQGGLLADRVKSGFGKGTEQYKNYIKFTRVTVPAAVNAAIKAEGANMSDDAKKLLISSLNPIAFDTDFETAMAQYKYFQELYGNQISPTTTESLTDLRQGIRSTDQSGNQANEMVTIRNSVTGETKTVTRNEAKNLGAL